MKKSKLERLKDGSAFLQYEKASNFKFYFDTKTFLKNIKIWWYRFDIAENAKLLVLAITDRTGNNMPSTGVKSSILSHKALVKCT